MILLVLSLLILVIQLNAAGVSLKGYRTEEKNPNGYSLPLFSYLGSNDFSYVRTEIENIDEIDSMVFEKEKTLGAAEYQDVYKTSDWYEKMKNLLWDINGEKLYKYTAANNYSSSKKKSSGTYSISYDNEKFMNIYNSIKFKDSSLNNNQKSLYKYIVAFDKLYNEEMAKIKKSETVYMIDDSDISKGICRIGNKINKSDYFPNGQCLCIFNCLPMSWAPKNETTNDMFASLAGPIRAIEDVPTNTFINNLYSIDSVLTISTSISNEKFDTEEEDKEICKDCVVNEKLAARFESMFVSEKCTIFGDFLEDLSEYKNHNTNVYKVTRFSGYMEKLPEYFDLREQGLVTPGRSSSMCSGGTSYVALASMLESLLLYERYQNPDFEVVSNFKKENITPETTRVSIKQLIRHLFQSKMNACNESNSFSALINGLAFSKADGNVSGVCKYFPYPYRGLLIDSNEGDILSKILDGEKITSENIYKLAEDSISKYGKELFGKTSNGEESDIEYGNTMVMKGLFGGYADVTLQSNTLKLATGKNTWMSNYKVLFDKYFDASVIKELDDQEKIYSENKKSLYMPVRTTPLRKWVIENNEETINAMKTVLALGVTLEVELNSNEFYTYWDKIKEDGLNNKMVYIPPTTTSERNIVNNSKTFPAIVIGYTSKYWIVRTPLREDDMGIVYISMENNYVDIYNSITFLMPATLETKLEKLIKDKYVSGSEYIHQGITGKIDSSLIYNVNAEKNEVETTEELNMFLNIPLWDEPDMEKRTYTVKLMATALPKRVVNQQIIIGCSVSIAVLAVLGIVLGVVFGLKRKQKILKQKELNKKLSLNAVMIATTNNIV